MHDQKSNLNNNNIINNKSLINSIWAHPVLIINRVWDSATGQEMRKLEGHTDLVRSVTVSSDNKTIISGSNDKTVRWGYLNMRLEVANIKSCYKATSSNGWSHFYSSNL